MTLYLASQDRHKFAPLLLVGYQDWVYDPQRDEWGIDGRAMSECLMVEPLDTQGICLDLNSRSTNFYALDGQHRLMAIMGLNELVRRGRLHALNPDRSPRVKSSVSLDEIVDRIHKETGESAGSVHERLQRIMDERIGVEIVPAVTKGESFDEALLRSRQMFLDFNEHVRRFS